LILWQKEIEDEKQRRNVLINKTPLAQRSVGFLATAAQRKKMAYLSGWTKNSGAPRQLTFSQVSVQPDS